MQTSAMRAYFLIVECNFSYAKLEKENENAKNLEYTIILREVWYALLRLLQQTVFNRKWSLIPVRIVASKGKRINTLIFYFLSVAKDLEP